MQLCWKRNHIYIKIEQIKDFFLNKLLLNPTPWPQHPKPSLYQHTTVRSITADTGLEEATSWAQNWHIEIKTLIGVYGREHGQELRRPVTNIQTASKRCFTFLSYSKSIWCQLQKDMSIFGKIYILYIIYYMWINEQWWV